MRAGESKEYLRSIQEDLAAETDPQLRAWYETEVSLQNDYQQAQDLHSTLTALSTGIRSLIDQKSEDETAGPEIADVNAYEDQAEPVDYDEYLTAEQRKRNAVTLWVHRLAADYDESIASARQQPKKSKREKQEQIAANKFKRSFENYGEDQQHIMYDGEALSYALDALLERQPHLASLVTGACIEFAQHNGLEFTKDSAAFAELFARSVSGQASSEQFDEIISGIYSGPNFVNDPLQAVELHINLAHALLEPSHVHNKHYYQKIVETVYCQNNVIKNSEEYIAATGLIHNMGLVFSTSEEFLVEALNAMNTFFQASYAYSDSPEQHQIRLNYATYNPGLAQHMSRRLISQMGGDTHQSATAIRMLDDKELMHYIHNGLQYDAIDSINIQTNEVQPNPTSTLSVPEQFRSAHEHCELRQKRLRLLAPRAVAGDFIINTLSKQTGQEIYPHVEHVPLGPGVALTYTTVGYDDQPVKGSTESDADAVIEKVFFEYPEWMYADKLQSRSDHADLVLGMYQGPLDSEHKLSTFFIIRQTVPADIAQSDPHSPLISSVGHLAERYNDTEQAQIRLQQKIQQIREQQHNYPGRRAIAFTLPDTLRQYGLEQITLRAHQDRSKLIVSTKHTDGTLEFVFSADTLRLDTHQYYQEDDSNIPRWPLDLAFQDLVVTLYGEWACRPVIETSEGIVSSEDRKSKVNLGFLRYLPEGWSFSQRQAQVFRLEQRGSLMDASQRRKSLDPSGLERNSTYVRETFDPTKPPLEIYYDKSVLATEY